MMRVIFFALIGFSLVLTACRAKVVEKKVTIESLSKFCIGEVSPERLIPCEVGKGLALTSDIELKYKCAIVVQKKINGSLHNLGGLASDGVLAWAVAFQLERGLTESGLSEIQKQFIWKESEAPLGFSRMDKSCGKIYYDAEMSLREKVMAGLGEGKNK